MQLWCDSSTGMEITCTMPLVETREPAKNTNLKSQTPHKERETKIYEVRQDAYVPEVEERSINDLHKVTRGLQLVLSRTHSEIFNSRSGFKSSFREENTPKTRSRLGPELL